MSLVSFKNIFTYGETSTMRSYIPATPATLFAIGLYPRIAGGPGEQHQCRDDGEGEDGGPQHRPALPSTKPKAGSVTAARGDRGREVLDRPREVAQVGGRSRTSPRSPRMTKPTRGNVIPTFCSVLQAGSSAADSSARRSLASQLAGVEHARAAPQRGHA